MNGTHAAAVRTEVIDRAVARIEAHLVRLAEGHDPLGHVFGIERLARAARSDWLETRRQAERDRPRP